MIQKESKLRPENRQATFIEQLMTEQRRHVSCVGDGGNRTHDVQVGRLNSTFALANYA